MIDIIITVEYTCRNICEEKDLENKEIEEIINEILDNRDYYHLCCDNSKISNIKIIKNEQDIIRLPYNYFSKK